MSDLNPLKIINFCKGSIVSFIYAVAVLTFNASAHECHWSFMNNAIFLRLSHVIVNVAIYLQMQTSSHFSSSSPHSFDGSLTFQNWLYSCIDAAITCYLIYRIRYKYVQGPNPIGLKQHGCMENKVVLITGANTGIGIETAKEMYNLGATVILACRSEKKAMSAIEEIQHAYPSTTVATVPPNKKLYFLPLDLSDLSSVRNAVKHFQTFDLPSLDILINNAGVLMGQHQKSKDGYELMMACNHLGHFLLTQLLLPTMRQNKTPNSLEPARVITLTSSTYKLASCLDLDDLMCEKSREYTLFGQYAQSKLANILFTTELARLEEIREQKSSSILQNDRRIKAYAVHPGLVRTDVTKNLPLWLRAGNYCFAFFIATLQKTPAAGAYTSLYCAISNEIYDKSGSYFVNSEVQQLYDCGLDVTVRDQKETHD